MDLVWILVIKKTDGCVCYLASLTSSRERNFGWCKITNIGVQWLAFMLALTKLDLLDCGEIADGGLRLLASLISLRDLDFGWCETLLMLVYNGWHH